MGWRGLHEDLQDVCGAGGCGGYLGGLLWSDSDDAAWLERGLMAACGNDRAVNGDDQRLPGRWCDGARLRVDADNSGDGDLW